MKLPIIGLTTYTQNNRYHFPISAVMEKYITAISIVGGVPILLPNNLDDDSIGKISSIVNGILFTGGGDLVVENIIETHHPENQVDTDRERDLFEFSLLDLVITKRLPFLGICRGLQMINVALGGTLYTHLPDQFPGKIKHNQHSGTEREYLAHEVGIIEGTQLSRIIQVDKTLVNSLHHQGINLVAPRLKPSAIASDGLVEGIELSNYPFGLAVQWHPEWLISRPETIKLFHAFIAAT